MELAFVFNLLYAIAVFAVFGTAGVLYWRRRRSSSTSEAVAGQELSDPIANETGRQMTPRPSGTEECAGPGVDTGNCGDSGGSGG